MRVWRHSGGYRVADIRGFGHVAWWGLRPDRPDGERRLGGARPVRPPGSPRARLIFVTLAW